MRRLITLSSGLIILAALVGACSPPPPETPAVTPTSAEVIPTQGAEATAASTTDPAATPEATAAPATSESPFAGEGPWTVSLTAADGTQISGTLYGQGTVGVILAPLYSIADQTAWQPFAQTLAAQGYRVLTFDYRGLGASEGEQNPIAAGDDLTAAVNFMKENQFQPKVIIGAGLGGSAAVRVASQDPSIGGVAVISAPQAFEGFEVTDAELSAVTVPSLWIGTRGDLTQNVEAMHELAGSTDKTLWVYEGSGVPGTFIFEGADSSDLQQRLIDFVVRVAGT